MVNFLMNPMISDPKDYMQLEFIVEILLINHEFYPNGKEASTYLQIDE